MLLAAICLSLLRLWLAAEPMIAQAQPAPALLFGIGVHIEPFGATPSALVQDTRPMQRGVPDYRNRRFFNQHLADLRLVAELVERYGGRLTIQAQTPFSSMVVQTGSSIFRDLESRGHEIGLHFHEDAHLGRRCNSLPVSTWAAVMQEEIDWLRRAGAQKVRYWSGGNLYPGLLDAATAAGLEVMSDYKNPRSQITPEILIGTGPWRPAGGPGENDLAAFASHDPEGSIIYLPQGLFDRTDFEGVRRSEQMGGHEAYFDFLTRSVDLSLNTASSDDVSVFHITIHAGEFRGRSERPFAVLEDWLREVVWPLLQSGAIRWAAFSEMADAFEAWEAGHPGADARRQLGRATSDALDALQSTKPVEEQKGGAYDEHTSLLPK